MIYKLGKRVAVIWVQDADFWQVSLQVTVFGRYWLASLHMDPVPT